MVELLVQIVNRVRGGEAVCLCTVVGARGSTPQGVGAAMIVLADGKTLGTLGGGCVEAEVRVQAQRLAPEKRSRLFTFRLDQDYGWDDGLVCGGTMDVAVQVISSADQLPPLDELLESVGAGREASIKIEVADDQCHPRSFEIPVHPAPRLLIAGGGHVGQALAEIAARAGFGVAVIDDRADVLSLERFPFAQRIAGDIEQELRRQRIDSQTYIVIVTRGHKHDGQALLAVVNSPARYIGLIGSKRKVHSIFTELHGRGISHELLAKVHAPIGLEIGAVTPAEIAVSIAAELIAARRGRENQPATPMKVPAERLADWLKS